MLLENQTAPPVSRSFVAELVSEPPTTRTWTSRAVLTIGREGEQPEEQAREQADGHGRTVDPPRIGGDQHEQHQPDDAEEPPATPAEPPTAATP